MKRLSRLFVALALPLCSIGFAHAASVVVAPANASKAVKAKADMVCDGKNDQVVLLASIKRAGKVSVMVDMPLGKVIQQKVENIYGRHSVEWLPGTYNLSGTLTIPDCADVCIRAEGTYFKYRPNTGDAVVVRGMQRCRYYFGAIECATTGAALRIKPTEKMPALMSIVNFNGLIGSGKKGTGLYLDSSVENVCTNRFEGTDIYGFNTGVFVSNARATLSYGAGGKCDTNWFWFSYIRICNTCVWEQGFRTDDNVYNVNVEASEPDSVAVRAGGAFGKWYVILGTADWFWRKGESKAKSLVLDLGAQHNSFEIHPPLKEFAPVADNSGNDTNVVLTTDKPSYVNLPKP